MDFTEYEDEYIKFKLSEGIIYVTYKVAIVDLKVAKHAISIKLKMFAGEKDRPVFTDYSRVIVTTKEAREIFATPESLVNGKAMAIVIESMVGSIMYNFFMKINKPKIPTRVFKDRDKALKWLMKYL